MLAQLGEGTEIVATIKVSVRQQQILDFVRGHIEEHGYPPSVREIGAAVGLASPSTVKHHLDNLERAGLLKRRAGSPRALHPGDSLSRGQESPIPPTSPGPSMTIHVPATLSDGDVSEVPLVGRIAAGSPILAEQSVDDFLALPTRLTGSGELFALEVKGDSMVEAAICDGDYVVVRAQSTAEDGDFVAALLDDEATVKELSHADGHRWLLPRNEDYSPILGDDALILGKVVTVIRSL